MTLPGLTEFFTASVNDNRVGSSHISLYMAMFQKWHLNGFQNPLQVTRRELMQLSHINAKNTYHKCLKELVAFGYINYVPSYHPVLGSMIYMNVMQAKMTLLLQFQQEVLDSHTEEETGPAGVQSGQQ